MDKNRRGPIGRKHLRIALGLAGLLALTLIASPLLIAHTGLRDSLLRSVINDPGWEISSTAASFGWMSPLTIDGMEMTRTDGSVRFQLARLAAEQPWWSLWFNSNDLGSLHIDQPRLIVAVDPSEDHSGRESLNRIDLPNFDANIRNASVKVYQTAHSDEPVIDVDKLDVHIKLVGASGDKRLKLDRLSVFDNQPLSPEICSHGLQLIAPVLDEELSVTGTISMHLFDLSIPIEVDRETFANQLRVNGAASLESVKASLTNPITRRLVALFAELLNLGEVPASIRLTDDTRLQFEVRDGRIFHESTAFLIPEVMTAFEFRSTGLVSLDETIDVEFSVRLPIELLGDGPLATEVSQTLIEVAVTGSISEPIFGLPERATWHSSLQDLMNDENLSPSDRDLADELRQLIHELQDR